MGTAAVEIQLRPKSASDKCLLSNLKPFQPYCDPGPSAHLCCRVFMAFLRQLCPELSVCLWVAAAAASTVLVIILDEFPVTLVK
jgi:hypothetical protein